MIARRAIICASAVAGLVAIMSPAPADAHAVLVKSVPAARVVLKRAPDRVQLWFNERLEPAFSTASVWSAAGTRVDRQDALVGPDDAKRLTITLPGLEPGSYTVRLRVLSVDGHIVEASFLFTVKERP